MRGLANVSILAASLRVLDHGVSLRACISGLRRRDPRVSVGRDGLTRSREDANGKARGACAVTDPLICCCHGRWPLLIAFSPLGEKVPKADEGTRERFHPRRLPSLPSNNCAASAR